MTRNHLPGGADLETFGRPLHAEAPFHGVGFGLGFAVVIDAPAAEDARLGGRVLYGVARPPRRFWVYPAEELTACFFNSCSRRARPGSAANCASWCTRQLG